MQERVFHVKLDEVTDDLPIVPAPEPVPLEPDEKYIMPIDVLRGFGRVLAIVFGLVLVYFFITVFLAWQGTDTRTILIEYGFGWVLR